MITLLIKAFIIFNRIQTHSHYNFAISSNSVLLDIAHAESHEAPDSKKDTVQTEKDSRSKLNSNLPQLLHDDLNSEEIKLLKDLSRRREELNRMQDNIIARENILHDAETKIDRQINELQSLNMKVEDIMKAYNDKEDGRIKSIVRIYENMKPKDAAKIFDTLEMNILLDIVSRMKESKVSPILAAMQTNKASELSVELTKKKGISSDLYSQNH